MIALHNIRNTDLYNLGSALYMAPFGNQTPFVVHYMGIQLQGSEELPKSPQYVKKEACYNLALYSPIEVYYLR